MSSDIICWTAGWDEVTVFFTLAFFGGSDASDTYQSGSGLGSALGAALFEVFIDPKTVDVDLYPGVECLW